MALSRDIHVQASLPHLSSNFTPTFFATSCHLPPFAPESKSHQINFLQEGIKLISIPSLQLQSKLGFETYYTLNAFNPFFS
ncbi:purine-nucleoside phosphorylase [Sesbania bispinosa]|nr:purine-nucleoside phosphorylase [Sesbania bispinosa]